ncbi:torsin-1A-like [Onychostoma macrolepis]|uniref:torsin-1A-like n=1 Tax=Onychostoma macrolepis TaxID=369639 RepID=UPI00272A9BDC|nr:torsin-1A-like [Onychostoma macrolepis]
MHSGDLEIMISENINKNEKSCKSARQKLVLYVDDRAGFTPEGRFTMLKYAWIIHFCNESTPFVIALLLLSNITLSSCFLDVFVAAASVVHTYFERDDLLPFDSKRLEEDLRENFFGQHIASNVILRAVSSFMTDSKPNKPLVLSLHGTTGIGKSHVAKIITRNVYKEGENSNYVHTYTAMYHFPHRAESDLYSAQLKQWIHGNVSSFPRSMFIFDEMDKMHPQLIDAIKPFLDYNARVDGVSFREAIFLFLSNAGGNVIAEVALDFWRRGKIREELRMNSKELEFKISQNIFNDKNNEVAKDMPYYPEEEEIFAVKGCKSVRQKLAQCIDF